MGWCDTKPSGGHLHVNGMTGTATHGDMLTLIEKLPLESGHSQCSDLVPYCDRRLERTLTGYGGLP
jgi:hypothetical protein